MISREHASTYFKYVSCNTSTAYTAVVFAIYVRTPNRVCLIIAAYRASVLAMCLI